EMKVKMPLLCRQGFACQGGVGMEDEIMQQEIRPVTAVEIIEQLHRQFAILSGGRGKDGAPIITFPEYPGFSEIPDEDFLNVIYVQPTLNAFLNSQLKLEINLYTHLNCLNCLISPELDTYNHN
uniref:MCF.2 cell line derived transforming sequence-like 2 n=1 Tax=Naja naja TaxID=35670 RepID=A0A8C6XPK2_NAJNA